ncbi:centrosome-associated protein ALMS1 isoform X2 [Lissotriton helveticus]
MEPEEGATGGPQEERAGSLLASGQESWYQLPAEDATAASATRFGVTGLETDQTEFPTLEEGTLMSSEDTGTAAVQGLFQSGLLEMQDTNLSPHLPLLKSDSLQVYNTFEETLFQRTELNFAPLRWTLDNSEFSELHLKPLQMHDAVQLASTEVTTDMSSGCFTISQHPLAVSTGGAGDASSSFFLSQHPLPPTPKSARIIFEHRNNRTEPYSEHSSMDVRAKSDVPNSQSPVARQEVLDTHEPRPEGEGYIDSITHDGSFLDNSVSAPMLLELLEKEVGLSSSGGSASDSSSNKVPPHTEPEQKQMAQEEVLDHMMYETESLGPEVPEVVIDPGALELLEKEIGLSNSSRSSLNSSPCMGLSSPVHEQNQIQQAETLDLKEHEDFTLVEHETTTVGSGFYLSLNKESRHELFKKEDVMSSSWQSSLDANLDPLGQEISKQQFLTIEHQESQMLQDGNFKFAERDAPHKIFFNNDHLENQLQQDHKEDHKTQETSDKRAATVIPEGNQIHQVGNLDLVEPATKSLEANFVQSLSQEKSISEFEQSKGNCVLSVSKSSKSSSETDLCPVMISVDGMNMKRNSVNMRDSGRCDLSGITVHPLNRLASGDFRDKLRTDLCCEIRLRHQEKEASVCKKNGDSTNENATPHSGNVDSEPIETCNLKQSTLSDVQPKPGNAEITDSSGYSIERGHREADISPFDRPLGNDSVFFRGIAQPISQSTPGAFPSKRIKKEIAGKMMPFMSNLPGSNGLLSEEPPETSKSAYTQSSGKQQSEKVDTKTISENSTSLSASPLPSGRIHSLPTLSYMEKVGAWKVNQSLENMPFDALVLRGINGVSPKKKAYNAVAESLNRILAKQSSTGSPKRSLSASIGGASSLTSLNSDERKPVHGLPIARSQSYSAISTVSKEMVHSEFVLDQNQHSVRKKLEQDKSKNASYGETLNTDEENLGDRTEQIKTSFENEEGTSPGNVHIQCLEASVPPTSQNVSDFLPGKVDSTRSPGKSDQRHSLEPGPSTSKITMEQFSDVSMDSNFLDSSQSNSQPDRTFVGSAGAGSGHSLTSLEVDNYAPYWSSTVKTPEKKELNIEERIPGYLRNLGIDQSPSTILNLFVPRGPIREPEFSPSELRTFKESADSTTKSMLPSEGSSVNAADNSPSSLYSGFSTISMSMPVGSDCGPDTPRPTELSLQFTLRNANERPISQSSITSAQGNSQPQLPVSLPCELSPQLPLTLTEETPAKKNSSNSIQTEDPQDYQTVGLVSGSEAEEPVNHNQQFVSPLPSQLDEESLYLVDKLEYGTAARISDSLTSSPLLEDSLDVHKSSLPLTLHLSASLDQYKEQGNDSFVGSKTLREIRQLLAEADNIHLGESNPTSPLTSLGGSHEGSFLLWRNLHGSQDSGAVRWSTESHSPVLRRRLSWDASLTSSLTDNHSLVKSASLTDGIVHWENLGNNDQSRKLSLEPWESVENMRAAYTVTRAEPEGCNHALDGRNAPLAVLHSRDDASTQSSIEKISVDPSARTRELLSSVSDAVSGLEQALAMTDGGRVKERPAVRESDDSSSVDSLAARVTSLLKGEAPAARATQMIQRSKEEERRACAVVKLKLAGQTLDSEADLNEEDRRRIEEIKTELLESAKKAGSAKHSRMMSWDSDNLHTPQQVQNISHVRDLELIESRDAIHKHGFWEAETKRHRPIQAASHGTSNYCVDESQQKASQVKAPMTFTLPDTVQAQMSTDGSFVKAINSDSLNPQFKVVDLSLKTTTTSADVPVDSRLLSDEATKPITSITFSSRKRTPSPSLSPINNSSFPEVSTKIVPLEVRPINSKEKMIDTQHSGAPKERHSASQNRNPANNVQKQTADEDWMRQDSTVIGKNQLHQSGDISLAQWNRLSPLEQSHSSDSQRGGFGKGLPLGEESHDLISAQTLASCGAASHNPGMPQKTTFVDYPNRPKPGDSSPSNLDANTGSAVDIILPTLSLLPKDQNVLVNEEKVEVLSVNQPFDQLSNRKEYNRRERSPSPSHASHTEAATVSSPSRKALSCVRVTIAPKPLHSQLNDVSSVMNSNTSSIAQDRSEAKPTGRLGVDEQENKGTKVVSSQSAEKKVSYLDEPKTGSSQNSYFLHSSIPDGDTISQNGNQAVLKPKLMHDNAVDSSTLSKQYTHQPSATKKSLSDAMTQITTESPEKTTFSAEIYIQDEDSKRPSDWSADKKAIGSTTLASSWNKTSHSSRSADQQLLLPYRPPGSAEMYYVLHPESISRLSPVRSDTTVESTHSGSNDAIPPKFPAEVLGSEDERASITVPIKHTEGIYSRRASPKAAWQENILNRTAVTVPEAHWELSETNHLATKSAQSHSAYIHPKHHVETRTTYASTSHQELRISDKLRNDLSLERHHLKFANPQEEDEKGFFQLKAELDDSRDEERDINLALRNQALNDAKQKSSREKSHRSPRKHPLTPIGDEWHERELSLKQSTRSSGSLDDLWYRFLERQKRHRLVDAGSSSHEEISLVERLDRLARLLQNPTAYSLMYAKDEPNRDNSKKREEKQGRQKGNKDRQEFAWTSSDLLDNVRKVHHKDKRALHSDSKDDWTDLSTDRIKGLLRKKQYTLAKSDSSSKEDQNSVTDSTVATESEMASQTGSDTATQTGTGSTVSTIDTQRLIRAFGPERVCPSSKLSHLYSTINHQKIRSEVGRRGNRKAQVKEKDRICFTELKRSRIDAQMTDAEVSSDTVSTASSSWGPSTALTNKKHVKHKGVQAGDLEIVMNGTKKNTRDVGMTFPSPRLHQEMPTRDIPHASGVLSQYMESRLSTPEDSREQKKWPNGILAEKIPRRRRPQPTGVTWVVPADDLKSGSRKENQPSLQAGHSPVWYEPLTQTRLWREPLREKSLQDQQIISRTSTGVRTAVTENKSHTTFLDITLQEALQMHRPGFISSSRERIKRLELIRKERKLQSMFQKERDQLFNPLEERREWQSTAHPDELILQKRRTISKKEMVERSKRIYEQLPEIRKRKEDEKRKSEYTTYRLKAQLFKTKVTNHVLGRKIPWN